MARQPKKIETEKTEEAKKPFSKEELEAILEVQQKINEERQARIDKLTGHSFDAGLKSSATGITRGERKEFKASNDLDIRDFHSFDEDMKETLLDFLLEKRGIENADDINEGELFMWMELIVGRTIDPIAFEGK